MAPFSSGKYSPKYSNRKIHKNNRKKSHSVSLLFCLLILVVFLVVIFSAVLLINEFILELTLQGEETQTVPYGDPYTDPGAQARFSGTLLHRTPAEVSVVSSGSVNTDKLGEYIITYEASYTYQLIIPLHFTQTLQRKVTVKDTVPPEITLISVPDSYTVPGEPYQEEGFQAKDNYDGDLTDRVVSTVSDGTVSYRVTDSSGNETVVTRKIRYHDPVAPVLELLGDSALTIQRGTEFIEPGFSAQDNCDGDITASVTVTGAVNTDRIGTYTLQYTAKDSYGNETVQTRTVKVRAIVVDPAELPDLPDFDPDAQVASNGRIIYLTFDDGPSAYTQMLLDILDAYGVKATFFVVGNNSDMMSSITEAGHTIAMHSYSHNYAQIYSSDEAYFNDLTRIQNLIISQTGVSPKLLRFPGGTANSVSRNYCEGIMTRISQKLLGMGYRYFDWNVSSEDASDAFTIKAVYQNVIDGIQKYKVSFVLQHDTNKASVQAVESIIQWGLSNGYTFLPLTETSHSCVARPTN